MKLNRDVLPGVCGEQAATGLVSPKRGALGGPGVVSHRWTEACGGAQPSLMWGRPSRQAPAVRGIHRLASPAVDLASRRSSLVVALGLSAGCVFGPPPPDGQPTEPTPPPEPVTQTADSSFDPTTPQSTPTSPAGAQGTPNQAAVEATRDLAPAVGGTLFLSMDAYEGGKASVTRAEDGAIAWTAELDSGLQGFCGIAGCAHHEALHSLESDRDFVTVIATRGIDQSSALYRMSMDDMTSVFTLTGFDFSGLPGSSCDTPPEITCGAPVANGQYETCRVGFAHTFEITEERPEAQQVSLIVGDHLGARMLGVTLSYAGGNSCATVDWVIDNQSPEWVPSCEPNSLQHFKEGDSDYVLVTCRNTNRVLGAGLIALYNIRGGGGDGQGTTLSRMWVYPQTDNLHSIDTILNSPHDGRIVRSGAGYTLSYAHTGGLSDDLDLDARSSVGVATLATLDQTPTYQGDLYLTGENELEALRIVTTVDWQEPGWFLVSDTAGYVTTLEAPPPRRMLFEAQHPTSTGKTGAWSADRINMNLVPLDDALVLQYPCGGVEAYQLVWLPAAEYGSVLRDAAAGAAQCLAP